MPALGALAGHAVASGRPLLSMVEPPSLDPPVGPINAEIVGGLALLSLTAKLGQGELMGSLSTLELSGDMDK